MIGHVSTSTLALYREGAVSARRAARIGSHLARCPRCAQIIADLAAVSVLLSSAEAPPLPGRLAERLQLALSTESAERASQAAALDTESAWVGATTGDSTAPHIPGRPDLPERQPTGKPRRRTPVWSSPLVLRGLAAAAAVVLVAGAGYLLANNSQGPVSTSQGSAAAPATPPRTVHEGLASPAALPAANGVRYTQNGQSATTTVLASGFDYTPANLATEVRKQMASTTGAVIGPAPTQRQLLEGGAQIGGIGVLKLEGCLSRISAGRKVLLADVARYLGKPATIIVLQELAATDVFAVVVVGLACSLSNGATITQAKVPAR